MLRHILAAILLYSLAAAQNPANEIPAAIPFEPHPAPKTNPGRDPSRAERAIMPATYEAYTFHNAIRRGRNDDAMIRLSPQGLVTSPRSPVSGVVPLRLDFQPTDGLAVSSFRYPKTNRIKVKFQAEPVPVSWWPQISFKVRADEGAALGPHALQGRLTFQVIDYSGVKVGPVQQMDVQIPITVAEHDAKVQKATWPENHLSPGMIVLMIALLPVEIPIGVLMLAGCAVSARSCPD